MYNKLTLLSMQVPLKLRYPFYGSTHWYVLQRYVEALRGLMGGRAKSRDSSKSVSPSRQWLKEIPMERMCVAAGNLSQCNGDEIECHEAEERGNQSNQHQKDPADSNTYQPQSTLPVQSTPPTKDSGPMKPAPEPTQPALELKQPALEPLLDPTQPLTHPPPESTQPSLQSAPQPVPEPTQPAPQPAPEPTQPALELIQPALEPALALQLAPEATQPAPQPVPEPTQPAPQPVPEATQQALEPAPQPVPEATQPALESVRDAGCESMHPAPELTQPAQELTLESTQPAQESTPKLTQPVSVSELAQQVSELIQQVSGLTQPVLEPVDTHLKREYDCTTLTEAKHKPYFSHHERGGLLLLVHKMKNTLFRNDIPPSFPPPQDLIAELEQLLQMSVPESKCSLEPTGVGVLDTVTSSSATASRKRPRSVSSSPVHRKQAKLDTNSPPETAAVRPPTTTGSQVGKEKSLNATGPPEAAVLAIHHDHISSQDTPVTTHPIPGAFTLSSVQSHLNPFPPAARSVLVCPLTLALRLATPSDSHQQKTQAKCEGRVLSAAAPSLLGEDCEETDIVTINNPIFSS